MTLAQRRAFIAVDEWLGIALCLYLHRTHDPAFVPVLCAFVVSVYVIAYPWFFIVEARQRGRWL